jgi:hypothetical protein
MTTRINLLATSSPATCSDFRVATSTGVHQELQELANLATADAPEKIEGGITSYFHQTKAASGLFRAKYEEICMSLDLVLISAQLKTATLDFQPGAKKHILTYEAAPVYRPVNVPALEGSDYWRDMQPPREAAVPSLQVKSAANVEWYLVGPATAITHDLNRGSLRGVDSVVVNKAEYEAILAHRRHELALPELPRCGSVAQILAQSADEPNDEDSQL